MCGYERAIWHSIVTLKRPLIVWNGALATRFLPVQVPSSLDFVKHFLHLLCFLNIIFIGVLLKHSNRLVASFKATHCHLLHPVLRIPSQSIWSSQPPIGSLKLNVDGSGSTNANESSACGIVWGSNVLPVEIQMGIGLRGVLLQTRDYRSRVLSTRGWTRTPTDHESRVIKLI